LRGDRRQCIERARRVTSAIDCSSRTTSHNLGEERNQYDEEEERKNEDTPRRALGPHLERRRQQAGSFLAVTNSAFDPVALKT